MANGPSEACYFIPSVNHITFAHVITDQHAGVHYLVATKMCSKDLPYSSKDKFFITEVTVNMNLHFTDQDITKVFQGF